MKRWCAVVGAVLVLAGLVFVVARAGAPKAREANPLSPDHSELGVTPLHGAVLVESDRFGLPGAIEVLGEYLVVADRLGDPAVHVVEKTTGRLVGSFGRGGDGPGEFRAPVSVDPIPGREAVWVFDITLQRLTRIELRDGRPRAPLEESVSLNLHANAPVTQPVWTGAERLLALGFFFEGRLAEFDARGTLLRETGQLPPNPLDVPVNVLLHAYQGTVKPRPDRSLLAVGARHAGWIEIYRPDGTLLRRVSGPFPFEPRFRVQEAARGPAMASGEDLRFGYIDLAATRDRIYALFSGRTRAGFPGRANYAEYVHVFDWEGNFLQAFRLDTDAFSIAVDEEAGCLYAVRHDPAPAVIRYRTIAETYTHKGK